MRVLLIEDDRKAAKLLAKGFQEEGFVVDVAPTGEARRFFSSTSMKSPRLMDKVTAHGVLVSRSGQLAHTGGRSRIAAS